MARRIILVLVAVFGLVLGVPSAPAEAAPTSCTVSTNTTPTCFYVGLTGTGRLTLSISSGIAAASVACTPIGSAFLAGTAPYFQSTNFARTGLCFLQLNASGSATASAS